MRFRPGKHGPVVDTASMALPFHQRLNILKSEQPHLSHVEAMQIVMKEQAESAKSELPAQILGVTPGPNGSALTMSPGTGLRSFTLDHVFPATTDQVSGHTEVNI